MEAQRHRIENEKGDGSRSAIEDTKVEEKWQTKDDRANTETTFYKSDIDKCVMSQRRKRRFKRMLRRQEGENPGETYSEDRDDRTQQNLHEDKRRMVGVYSSQLELTRHQKERINHIVLDIFGSEDNEYPSFNTFGFFSTEQAILGIVNCVAREDGRWIEDEETFQSFMEDLDLTKDNMKMLRKMVRDRLPST